MRDWDEVVAYACSLPEVEMGSHLRAMVPKANGRALVGPSREHGSFGLSVSSIEEKRMLIETDPDTFWDTPHYANYPAVLVRYGADEADERVELYIRRAWWDRLKKKQRQAYGERP
jgi:hypothetical protein